MKKTSWMVFILAGLGLWSCGEKKKEDGWELTLRGKVNYPQAGEIRLSEMRKDQAIKPFEDTIVLNSKNEFEKRIKLKQPGYYQLNFYNNQVISVILDHSDLTVDVDGNGPGGNASVKGSPDVDLINRIQKLIAEAQQSEEAKAIEAEFQTVSQLNDQKKIEEVQQRYMALIERANNEAAEILRSQPPSLGLIHLLQNAGVLDPDKYVSLYIDAAAKFEKEWPEVEFAKEFVAFVAKLKATAIGQPAPEISLPDPSGKIVSLSSFRGKYVLVDFWAKWCGPCRRENPNVVKAYNQFKGKNFDILGVSLDRTKADWLQAIQEDGLVWNHVSDLKYFESRAAQDYNINGIPFSILVDPSGKIIAKNLRGSELQKTLESVLN